MPGPYHIATIDEEVIATAAGKVAAGGYPEGWLRTASTRRSRAVHWQDLSNALRVQGLQRRILARVERDGFFPQRVLACSPIGRSRTSTREADWCRPARGLPCAPEAEPLILAPVQRLPAGQRHPATGLEDPFGSRT